MCDISDVKYIEVERLEQELFYKGKKCEIFSIGIGGGKTTQTVEYLDTECQQKKNHSYG